MHQIRCNTFLLGLESPGESNELLSLLQGGMRQAGWSASGARVSANQRWQKKKQAPPLQNTTTARGA
jgi:hypothetical protein